MAGGLRGQGMEEGEEEMIEEVCPLCGSVMNEIDREGSSGGDYSGDISWTDYECPACGCYIDGWKGLRYSSRGEYEDSRYC